MQLYWMLGLALFDFIGGFESTPAFIYISPTARRFWCGAISVLLVGVSGTIGFIGVDSWQSVLIGSFPWYVHFGDF